MSDIVNEVVSAPETFTSWDKCMEKTYCKWPAIIGIVIASLIAISILWCLIRCICCGVQICTCCCGGCGGRKHKRDPQFKDDYSRMPPTPYGGYQPAPSPMMYNHAPAPAPMMYNQGPPQFATFDDPSSKRQINEDSLPHMPSWDTAVKRRVEDHSAPQMSPNGDVEMGALDSRARGGYNSVPNGPMSPASPPPPHHHQNPDYFNTGMTPAHGGDLGDQRLGHQDYQETGFHAVPLSPPPTYRSAAPSVTSDRFIASAASPSPYEYNTRQMYDQQSSYAPSSTVYEPSGYSNRISMPKPYSPPPVEQLTIGQQYGNRPPSFLQPGSRRPVPGTYREV